ncbi:MAG: type II toxin-antitoxin system VapB family antitoxin [Deltaproteobacteria bacterium]|nr:type II toxin-antitoxin system VapB family antitoxin [Deltaproteobacteria bacterium]
MKTTIDIADALLARAKKVAAREHTTVRALVEESLRRLLAERDQAGSVEIKPVTFRGEGLQPELGSRGWEAQRDMIYEDRGG